jgi:hypothetical protein
MAAGDFLRYLGQVSVLFHCSDWFSIPAGTNLAWRRPRIDPVMPVKCWLSSDT